MLGPVLAKPVARLLGAPLPRLRGMSGTLASENAVRNPRRTASTAAALMIGVGIVVFILVLAASVKQSITDITGSQLKADYIINTTTGGFGNSVGFSPDLATNVSALPEVQSVSGMRFGAMQVNGDTKVAFAVDPTTIEDVYDFVNVTGSIQDLSEINTIAVDKKVAEKNGWAIGTTIDVTFAERDDADEDRRVDRRFEGLLELGDGHPHVRAALRRPVRLVRVRQAQAGRRRRSLRNRVSTRS